MTCAGPESPPGTPMPSPAERGHRSQVRGGGDYSVSAAMAMPLSPARRCFTSVDPVLDRRSQRQLHGGRALPSFLSPAHPTRGSKSTPVKPPQILVHSKTVASITEDLAVPLLSCP